jgi:hypothetical protein
MKRKPGCAAKVQSLAAEVAISEVAISEVAI